MWRKAVTLLASLLMLSLSASSYSFAASDTSISVMTRNIYLGADVGVALNLLPDLPAAAQYMWDQMRKTDFEKRAKSLAREFAAAKPDVIGIQEATKWICKKGLVSRKKTVYDFLEILIEETKQTEVGYSLIQKDGEPALNTGFSIPAIPRLTIVKDSELFPSLFGQEEAACGFEIADALLVRDELNAKIVQLGNSEYKRYYTVVPVVMEIHRGYTWADLEIQGKSIRIVTTHLESLFDDESAPHSSVQAEQLITDLLHTKSPLIVMGDFNADPRDPRGKDSPNPGGQPSANTSCEEQQQEIVSGKSGIASCNAYWKMMKAGFEDAGPNALDATNFTWGASALLNGPDVKRGAAAKEMGNSYGLTDRLDYIFVKNGITVISSYLTSNTWPEGRNNWECNTDSAQQSCLPSDHAGLVAKIKITNEASSTLDKPLPDNQTIPWLLYAGVLAFVTLLVVLTWVLSRVIIRPLYRLAKRNSRSERAN